MKFDFHQSTKECIGSNSDNVRKIAKDLGRSYETVRKWGRRRDGQNTGEKGPVDDVAIMMSDSLVLGQNRKSALAPLKALNNYFNVPFLDVEIGGDAGELTQKLLSSIEEFGQLASEASEAIKDGEIRQNELERIHKEGWEAAEAIIAFIKSAEQAVTE